MLCGNIERSVQSQYIFSILLIYCTAGNLEGAKFDEFGVLIAICQIKSAIMIH